MFKAILLERRGGKVEAALRVLDAVRGDLPNLANKILKDQIMGRLVVDVNG